MEQQGLRLGGFYKIKLTSYIKKVLKKMFLSKKLSATCTSNNMSKWVSAGLKNNTRTRLGKLTAVRDDSRNKSDTNCLP